MEIKSLLDERKTCPECFWQMQYLFSWIEHDGFGHTGCPIAWVCPKCQYKEDLVFIEKGKVTNG